MIKAHASYLSRLLKALVCVVALYPASLRAQPTPEPAPSPNITPSVSHKISDLQVQMAESAHKILPSLRSLSDLTTSLENYLTSGCFGPIFKTLSYDGPPSDPMCAQRTDQLLALAPRNPVGLCARDGIAAPSCVEAYREQIVERFDGGSLHSNIPDTAIRAGLSMEETNKVGRLAANLESINARYKELRAAGDKTKLFALITEATENYEQILSITCKTAIVAVRNQEETTKNQSAEERSIETVREKLLKVPKELRGDYQRQALEDAEKELVQAKSDPAKREAILRKIKVIENPEVSTEVSMEGKLRVRILPRQCYDYIEQASTFIPAFSVPICHKNGWYSPQCIGGIKSWMTYKQRLEREASANDPNRPTPRSVISSF